MSAARTRPGLTLLELLLQLSILAVLLAMAAPLAGRALDRIAVTAARDALVAALERTRAAAVAHGGARLYVDLAAGRCWTETAGGAAVGAVVDLGHEYRVRVHADGDPPPTVALEFDRLGIGRMSSRTFRLRRGVEEGRVAVSAYGRVRVW